METQDQLLPLVFSGQHKDADSAVVSEWETIENAIIDGDDRYPRYTSRKGLDKKADCPISDVHTFIGYREGGFALGGNSGSIYNIDTDTWSDKIDIDREYEIDIKPMTSLASEYLRTESYKAQSKIIIHKGYLIHGYLSSDDVFYIDTLNKDGSFVANLLTYKITRYYGDNSNSNLYPRGIFDFIEHQDGHLVVSIVDYVISPPNSYFKIVWFNIYNVTYSLDGLKEDFAASTLFKKGSLIEQENLSSSDVVALANQDYTSTGPTELYLVNEINASAGALTLLRLRTDNNLIITIDTIYGAKLHFVKNLVALDKPILIIALRDSGVKKLSYYSEDSITASSNTTYLTYSSDVTFSFFGDDLTSNFKILFSGVGKSGSDSLFSDSSVYTINSTTGSLDYVSNNSQLIVGNNTGSILSSSVFSNSFDPATTNGIGFLTLISSSNLGGTNLRVTDANNANISGVEDKFILGVFPISKPFYSPINNTIYAFFRSMVNYNSSYADHIGSVDPINNRCYLIPIVTNISATTADIINASTKHITDGEYNSSYFNNVFPSSSFAYGENIPFAHFTPIYENGIIYFPYFSPQPKIQISSQFYMLYKHDFNKPLKQNAIDSYGTLLISGNVMKEFDGFNLVENSFFVAPTIMTTGQTAGTNTWKYIAIYTYVDSRGNKTFSRPSSVFTATLASQVQLAISSCTVTLKKRISIEIYRTENNGSTFRRVKVLANDLSRQAVLYTDDNDDSVITNLEEAFNHPYIYSDGTNILVNEHISFAKNLTLHNGRVFLQNYIDNVTYYSKAKTSGESVSFSYDLTLDTNAADLGSDSAVGRRGVEFNRIGALASLFGYLVIFEENRIYVISGDGADPDGTNISFSDIELLSQAVGCADPDTVVNLKYGVLFKGTDSWYHIRANLVLDDVGDDVDKYFDYDIQAAGVNYRDSLAYFTIKDLNKILVFDFKNQYKWYDFTTPLGNFEDIGVIKNNLALIKSGLVDNFFIQGSNYNDNGLSYPMVFKTGWISLSKIQGYQRIKRLMILGNVLTNEFIYQLKEYSNFDNNPVLTKSFIHGKRQVEFHITRQKSDSLKFELIVTPTNASDGRTIDLTSMVLKVAVTNENYKVGAKG